MRMSRRSVLALFGLAAGALSLGGLPADSFGQDKGGKRVRLTILHTNDIHGHLTAWRGWEGDLEGKTVGGLPRLASAVKAARQAAGNNVLLLDAGDLLADTMLADLSGGRALIEALNFLSYDAMTVGNHEPDFGAGALGKRVKEAKFAVVAANLAHSGKPFLRPYVIKTVGGVKVGILGLAYPKTPRTTAKKNVEGLSFDDPIRAVTDHLPKMRADGAEVTVVLSHLGLGGDQHLARAVEGIDVIVGGHSHNRMRKAELVGKTLIVQAGAHGSDLGRLDLMIEKGRVAGHERTLVPLTHDTVPSDPDAEKLLEALISPHRKAMHEVVGTASDWLIRAQTLAGQEARTRDQESPVDSLFADILRAETKADIGLLPGVGYGVAIPPGDVTAAALRQLLPHDGKVVTMRLTGREVADVLEQAVENTFTSDPAIKVGGMIQVSGIRFRYDPELKVGARVTRLERADGPWDPAAEYTVVTNAMLAGGGHNYRTLTMGRDRKEHGSQYDTVRAWFTKHSPVAPPAPGRIRREKKD